MHALGRAGFAAGTYPLPPRGGGGNKTTGHGGILWRPAGGGDAQTWAEVMAFVASTLCPFPIFVDFLGTPGHVPVGTYDMHGCWFEGQLPTNTLNNIVVLDNGAVLHDLSSIYGGIVMQRGPGANAGACLTFSPAPFPLPQVFLVDTGANIQNMGSAPMIQPTHGGGGGGPDFVLVFRTHGQVPAGGTSSILGLTNQATAFLYYFESDQSLIDPATVVSGDNTSKLAPIATEGIAYSGSPPGYQYTSFLGTLIPGSAGMIGGSGPSSLRPIIGPQVGCMYFDTSLGPDGKPIWFVGNPPSPTGWVDATGIPA